MQLSAMPHTRRTLCALALAACAAAGAARADQCAAEADALTSLGEVMYDGSQIVPGMLQRLNYAETNLGVRYVRLLLKPSAAAGSAWQLTLRDSRLRLIDTLSSEQAAAAGALWTRRLYTGGEIYLDLQAASAQTRIEVARAIVMREDAPTPYYSLQTPGVYAFSSLYDAPTQLRKLGDYVGFLTASWDRQSWCCSGIAVGDDLFLTNWHCGGDARALRPEDMWSPQVCDATFIDFSWDGDNVDREFTCAEVVDKDEANDFALLRIRPLRGVDRLRLPVLRKDGPRAGEPIRIVHHPACRPKQISLSCAVRDAALRGWRTGAGKDFSYPCDTEGGSSGAPVFDANDRLIGIHHLGFQKIGGKCDLVNKGVGLEGVLEAMRPESAARLRQLMEH